MPNALSQEVLRNVKRRSNSRKGEGNWSKEVEDLTQEESKRPLPTRVKVSTQQNSPMGCRQPEGSHRVISLRDYLPESNWVEKNFIALAESLRKNLC